MQLKSFAEIVVLFLFLPLALTLAVLAYEVTTTSHAQFY